MIMGRHANVAVFVPHLGCPQRCSFCEQNTITGANHQPPPTPEDVLFAAGVAAGSARDLTQTEIAFFGGSFTAINREYMLALLAAAKSAVEQDGFKGVRCSTRPDAIDQQVLDVLKSHHVTAIELGAQSMDREVLALNRRGHTPEDTCRAAGLIRGAGIELGLQMMTGLYKDTDEKAIETARQLIALTPATVRIYPTIVLAGTELAKLYEAGVYRPQELWQAVELCGRLLGMFEAAGIRVIRLGLHAGQELEDRRVAGPYHPAFRQLCESKTYLDSLLTRLEKTGPGDYTVEVEPRMISTALGQGKRNLKELERRGYNVTFKQKRPSA